jgi:hypothetical protein
MLLGVDLTAFPLSARQEVDALCRGQKAEALAQAKQRQLEAAKWYRDHPPRAIEGLGGQTSHFDPVLWSVLRNGAQAAPGEDREIQQWMVRKHPEAFRVRHLPSKTTFGYWTTPERRSARVQNIDAVTRGQVRFSKSYEG